MNNNCSTSPSTRNSPPNELQLFPSKPKKANFNQQVDVFTNSYKLTLKDTNIQVHKYSLHTDPELPDNSRQLNKLTSLCRDIIKEKLSVYLPIGRVVYSLKQVQDTIEKTVEHDGVTYTLKLNWSCSMRSNDIELNQFFCVFFKQMTRKVKFEQIGRNMYNPKKMVKVQGIEIWPGLFTSCRKQDGGTLVQLELSYKCIREDNLFDLLRQKISQGESHEQISEDLKFKSVVTRYGNNSHTYQIDRIDFSKSPQDKFSLADGKETNFLDYYSSKYQVKIKDPNQPICYTKSKRSGQEIGLIPELCFMTGLTDTMRSNFNLMKDVNQVLQRGAQDRMRDIVNFVNDLQSQQKVQEFISPWGISLGTQPIRVKAQQVPAGKILMGNSSKNFPANSDQNAFDRNIQNQMFKSVELTAWGIIFSTDNQKEANQFKDNIEKACQTLQVKCQPPRMFPVQNGRQFQSWQKLINEQIKPPCQAVVCICAGRKKAAPLYKDLKKMFTSQVPVASQVVLADTISRGKNLISIVVKILIQIQAKLSAVPWAIETDDLKVFKQPTMVIGYDVHHKKHQNSTMAFNATIDRNFCRYWTRAISEGECQEFGTQLDSTLKAALDAFKKSNTLYPKYLFILRDGVGDSQKQLIVKQEIPQLKQALIDKEETKEIKICFLMCNKKVNTKLIEATGETSGRNPKPGCMLDHTVTGHNEFDFYMVCTESRQGVPTPTHFTVLYNDVPNLEPEEIMKLAFKLCYTFYNFSGPVKVPAPVKYADRQAAYIGELRVKPHLHHENTKGLYFI